MIDLGRETGGNNEICLGVRFALCMISHSKLIAGCPMRIEIDTVILQILGAVFIFGGQGLRRRTSDQTVLGSNPAVAAALGPWTRLFTPIVPRRSLHISFY